MSPGRTWSTFIGRVFAEIHIPFPQTLLLSARHALCSHFYLFIFDVICIGNVLAHCYLWNLAGAVVQSVHKVLIVSVLEGCITIGLIRDALLDLDIHIVWDEAGSWPEGQLMQRNTFDTVVVVFFVCLFVTLSSLFLRGHFEDFLLKPGYKVAQQLQMELMKARIALDSQQLFHRVHVGLWGGCDLSRGGKEDAASVRALPCRPFFFVRLPLDNHVLFPHPEQVVTWIFELQGSCPLQPRWRVSAASHRGCVSGFVRDAMLLTKIIYWCIAPPFTGCGLQMR